MTAVAAPSREIDGKGRTVRELLANQKYAVDFYQREYKWERKQVVELLNDLATEFFDSYDEGHERAAIARYGHYSLGCLTPRSVSTT